MKGFHPFKCLLSAAVWVAICVPAGAPLYGTDKPITVGVVIDEATRAEREPLQDYLTKAMGRPVNLAAPDSYRETVAHLADGSYDFACLGALMYMRAHAEYGVIPLVRRTIDLHYRSVFITAADSSIHSLSDLKGKQFAFGDIDSTSAHLVAYRELSAGGNQSRHRFQVSLQRESSCDRSDGGKRNGRRRRDRRNVFQLPDH